MKIPARALRTALVLTATALAPMTVGAAATPPTPAAPAPGTPKRHTLRGIITSVISEKSAFVVKHEDIPGVMRAMTMMFQVDAATLKAFKTGDTITGLMSRQGNAWVLEEVKPAAAASKK